MKDFEYTIELQGLLERITLAVVRECEKRAVRRQAMQILRSKVSSEAAGWKTLEVEGGNIRPAIKPIIERHGYYVEMELSADGSKVLKCTIKRKVDIGGAP